MKTKIWWNGLIIIGVIGILYLIYSREFKDNSKVVLSSGDTIISKKTWHSMLNLANKKPEIRIDTVYVKGDVVYLKPDLPKPVLNDSINEYKDSIENNQIDVNIDLKIKGELLSCVWYYKPIKQVITTRLTEYVPKLVNNEIKVEVPKNGFYVYGLVGGNQNSFMYGAGIDLITKKDKTVGYFYQRLGNKDFHSVKVGFRLVK